MNKLCKIREKILGTDFSKFFKRFLPLAIVIILLGGLAVGFGLRSQIWETITYLQETEYDREHDGKVRDGSRAVYEEEQQQAPASVRYHEQEHGDGDFFEELPLQGIGSGMKMALGIYGGICLLLFAVYWLAVAGWLYKAAVLSKMNGLLWLIIGLLGNVPAVLLFLMVRSLIRRKCPLCGCWQRTKTWFCTNCKAELNRNCPQCGKLCSADDKYCGRCGYLLDKTEAEENQQA